MQANYLMMNCTPHPVTFILAGGVQVTLPPSGNIVRCAMRPVAPNGLAEIIPGVAVPVIRFEGEGVVTGEVEGLPAPEEGRWPSILVGMFGAGLVAARYPGEVYVVDTSPDSVVRSATGAILGIRRIARAIPTRPRMGEEPRSRVPAVLDLVRRIACEGDVRVDIESFREEILLQRLGEELPRVLDGTEVAS